MEYNEIQGDLIINALKGNYDVIAHGVNCFCRQKSGIAEKMVSVFKTNTFYKEGLNWVGKIEKLGNIIYEDRYIHNGEIVSFKQAGYYLAPLYKEAKRLIVVNCYTQYKIAKFSDVDYNYTTTDIPFDYEAFTLCMRKMNIIFKGKHIGLPQIGIGKAKANWEKIKEIIQKELKDCKVTIVIYDKN